MIDHECVDDAQEAIISALESLERLNEVCRLSEIGKLSIESRSRYNDLYQELIYTNGPIAKKSLNASELKQRKGLALENLASFLLDHSGNLFAIKRNIRTNTNEIDQFCELTSKGCFLQCHGFLQERFSRFIGECKNYDTTVSVTYVGKFYSLLNSTAMKLGVLFSYKGISGSGWKDGAGLVKKIYISKEVTNDRICIIDFNKADFDSIAQGGSFLEIIVNKINCLQLDASYDSYISIHPVELVLKSEE